MAEHPYPPDSLKKPVAIPAHLAIVHLEIIRRLHFSLCFQFLLFLAMGFPGDSSLTVSLLSVAGFSVLITVSCDEDVEKAGVNEVEELVEIPGTTN